ncbi:MAG: DUF262 domain-containing protein [Nitrososphaerota archaeon]|nr:DUF262 domain-containing protein [Nitrososphaerota archaeon]
MPADTLVGTATRNAAPEEGELEVEGDDAETGAETSPTVGKRTIHTSSSDREIESLYNRWKKGRLILQPDFQRQFVWDRAKASRLIESVLMSVPLPIIYLAEGPDGKEYVIDGQQRLTSFFSFFDGKFPSGDPFHLGRMSVFPELEGKSCAELDEAVQDRIRSFDIRTVVIMSDSDPDLKFEIFERLNTGAVPLNDMELRNCVFRGSYMDLLRKLAADPDFGLIVGLKGPDKRMRDVELVLRFAAFYHATYLRYQSPMKRFFNRDMEKYQNINKTDEDSLKKAFENSVQIVKSLFGTSAFRRFNPGIYNDHNGFWETTRFNASLYDVIMGVFCDVDKSRAYGALESLREGFIDLMSSNEDFRDAILLGTSEPARVKTRFDLARMMVDDVLKTHPAQPRCFSRQLKEDLFEQDPVCAICNQRITLLDDAAVDHIEQYWRGGQTIPENARLTHRYCNNARPRKS